MTMGEEAKTPEEHESGPSGEENDARAAAKEKFLGALSEMFEESSDSEVEAKKPRRKKILGTRRKKLRVAAPDPTPAAFVMKLFDRSVDLTQFGTLTPLYPICRAWFQNNPKDFIKRPSYKKREDKLSPRDVTYVPVPAEDEAVIPPPMPTFKPENETCPIMKGENVCKADLLGDNRKRWLRARARAKQNYTQRCARYHESFQLLQRVREEVYVL